jgi:hypothetical protein
MADAEPLGAWKHRHERSPTVSWRNDEARHALTTALSRASNALQAYRNHEHVHPVGKSYAQVCLDALDMIESLTGLKMQAGGSYIFRTDLKGDDGRRMPSTVSRLLNDLKRVFIGFKIGTSKQLQAHKSPESTRDVSKSAMDTIDHLLGVLSVTRFD